MNEIIKDIEKKYGDGSVIKLDDSKKIEVDVIPTGLVSIDYILGIGGIPQGRIIEVFGDSSSGKTTLALHLISQAQMKNIQCAFIDAEHSFDGEYAKKIGVKLNDLVISQPDSGETALDICESLIKSGEVGLIIVDSVSALLPRAEIEGEIGKSQIGLQARLMSQALRKLAPICSKNKSTLVFINQERMKIQTFGYGNPTTTSGGLALKFYTSIRVEMQRAAKIRKGDDIVGNRVKVNIAKNKLAAPFKATEVDIIFNEGICEEADLLNFGLKYEVLKKDGNTIFFGEEKLGKSMDSAVTFLKENQEILNKINKEIKTKLKLV